MSKKDIICEESFTSLCSLIFLNPQTKGLHRQKLKPRQRAAQRTYAANFSFITVSFGGPYCRGQLSLTPPKSCHFYLSGKVTEVEFIDESEAASTLPSLPSFNSHATLSFSNLTKEIRISASPFNDRRTRVLTQLFTWLFNCQNAG